LNVDGKGWGSIAGRLTIVKLSAPVVLLVPSLLIYALPKATRGFSFYPGRLGVALGGSLAAGSVLIGWLLGGAFAPEGAAIAFWLLGTTGVAMVVSTVRPLAFVKPICTRCRLLPIIGEHESLHLSGVVSESEVWSSMRTRHSNASLRVDGDPAICSFCPIPKRLAEK
jgi:hypothetical protein